MASWEACTLGGGGLPCCEMRLLNALSSSSSSYGGARLLNKLKLRPLAGYGTHLLVMASSSSSSAQTQRLASDIETLISYHDRTKHSFHRYAQGPHGLDWASQPNPFRRYPRASLVPLRHLLPLPGPASGQLYSRIFSEFVKPSALSKDAVSQLLYDSFALSAWKKAGSSVWSLRVNPSSGNLHPTEAYFLSGPLVGVADMPFVAHYAPKEHALEIRAEISLELWRDLTKGLPPGTVFIGLTSIFWREAWKYGERAFRYCNHDVGHALGAIAMAGACLGWDSVLLDGWGNEDLDLLLGVAGRKEIPAGVPKKGYRPELEQEHADCLVALFPGKAPYDSAVPNNRDSSPQSRPKDDSIYKMSKVIVPSDDLVLSIRSRMAEVEWKGKSNTLSKDHLWWDVIDTAASASVKPTMPTPMSTNPMPQWVASAQTYVPLSLRQIINKRRSAVSMDGKFILQRESFYQMLWKALPSGLNSELQGDQQQFPFRVLPWKAELHMAIFVHKVSGLPKGLYFLVRNSNHEQQLRRALRPEFKWEKPQNCPQLLPLYRLTEGDCEKLAMQVSCFQDIAGDSCFSLGMIARFDGINERGAWMYPRLFWESGVLGQLLYLEAHALGISATGIGCYFDDAVHQILGLKGKEFQSLYHFTIGAPVVDKRIMSLPAYPGPNGDA